MKGKISTMVRVVLLVVMLVTFALVVPAPVRAESGNCQSYWYYQQDYYMWGPACTFNRDIRIAYHFVNEWTWHINSSGDVNYFLEGHGVCYIYELLPGGITGLLLATEPCYHFVSINDLGGDAVTQYGYGACRWFDCDCGHPNVEYYSYYWNIRSGQLYGYHAYGGGGSCNVWYHPHCTWYV